jgi:hypothetical protein
MGARFNPELREKILKAVENQLANNTQLERKQT